MRVFTLCTGNRARSPLAEALLRRAVGDRAEIASRGLLDLGPLPALDEAVDVGRELGVDLSPHRARPLAQRELDAADLVLGFEPDHISAAVVDGGASIQRTFTILELHRLLCELQDVQDFHTSFDDLLEAAHERRTPSFLRAPTVDDPYGRPYRVFADVGRVIDQCVVTIAAALLEGAPTAS